MTAMYIGKRYRECKAKFSGYCPVTVIHRVTTIYRAFIYRFDCTVYFSYMYDSSTKTTSCIPANFF